MTRKATYSQLAFNIYITKEDVPTLLKTGEIWMNVYIGKELFPGSVATVELDERTRSLLRKHYNQEREALGKGQIVWDKGQLKSVSELRKKRKKKG